MTEQRDYAVQDWPFAWGEPAGSGELKCAADDFIVVESLPFTPEGCGEHVFLQIEKVGENTEYVTRMLARHAGVRQRDIGFAGLKDRHARTTQWFSVWLPGKDILDWSGVETESIRIRQIVRHGRKLKRGIIAGNCFQIRIRNWRGDQAKTNLQLKYIEQHGFPNYFAEQRFGRSGQNVNKALALLEGKKLKREQQSIYLSAVRSYVFNLVLAERVRQHNWNELLSGDICQLRGSRSLFRVDIDDLNLQQRLQTGDIQATGILWGEGDMHAVSQAGEIEQLVIDRYPELTSLLTKFGLKMDRRALRTMPEQLEWSFPCSNELYLGFSLPAGSYATALIREILSPLGKVETQRNLGEEY